MKNIIYLPSSTRGNTNIGWLNGYHSFNFGNFNEPSRNAFGPLIIFNDDIVQAGKGFGTHAHSNMEIISIPISGSITHRDSTGKTARIHTGDIQIMGAGTGITHSEYNDGADELNFLQIWIQPKIIDTIPRYEQITIGKLVSNEIKSIISPNPAEGELWINQDAWLSIGKFDSGNSTTYQLGNSSNGVYVFVIEGEAVLGEQVIAKRDALKVSGIEELKIDFKQDSQLLFIEVKL